MDYLARIMIFIGTVEESKFHPRYSPLINAILFMIFLILVEEKNSRLGFFLVFIYSLILLACMNPLSNSLMVLTSVVWIISIFLALARILRWQAKNLSYTTRLQHITSERVIDDYSI